MATKTLTIRITGDVRNALKGFNNIHKELNNLLKHAQSVTRQIQGMGVKGVGGVKSTVPLGQKIAADTKQVADSIQKNIAGPMQSVQKEARKAATGTQRYLNQQNKLISSGGMTGKALHDVKSGFMGVEKSVVKASRGIKGFVGDILGFAKFQAKWMLGIGVVLGTPAAIIKAGKAYADYEQNMKNVWAVTGATREEIDALGKTIRKAGRDTLLGSKQAGEASVLLAQAGLTVKEIAKALPVVGKLLAIPGATVQDAVKNLATIKTAWGMTADDMERIADTIAKATDLALIDIKDLSTVFNYLASTAAQASIPLERIMALVVALSKAGVQASTIGTGLRRLIVELIDRSPRLVKALRGVGLSFKEVALPSNDIIESLIKMQKAGMDVTTIFEGMELRSAAAANAIFTQVESLRKYEKELTDSNYLATFWSKAVQGTKVQMKLLRNQVEDLSISIGEKMNPAIKLAVKYLNSLVSALQTVFKEGAIAQKKLESMSVVGKGLLLAVLSLVSGFKHLWNTLKAGAEQALSPIIHGFNLLGKTIAITMATITGDISIKKAFEEFKNLASETASNIFKDWMESGQKWQQQFIKEAYDLRAKLDSILGFRPGAVEEKPTKGKGRKGEGSKDRQGTVDRETRLLRDLSSLLADIKKRSESIRLDFLPEGLGKQMAQLQQRYKKFTESIFEGLEKSGLDEKSLEYFQKLYGSLYKKLPKGIVELDVKGDKEKVLKEIEALLADIQKLFEAQGEGIKKAFSKEVIDNAYKWGISIKDQQIAYEKTNGEIQKLMGNRRGEIESNIRLIELQKQRAIWQAKLSGATNEEIEALKRLYELRKGKEEEALRRQESQWGAFKGGFKDVVKSWGDAMSQMEQIGKDTANAIQSQFSNLLFDFASGDLARHNKEIKNQMDELNRENERTQEQMRYVQEEYDAGRMSAQDYSRTMHDLTNRTEEYNNKMGELKSQLKGVGDYALSAARAILRSLTDAMAKQIASGFLEWLGRVWKQGILKNHEDSKAIVNNITLTGVMGKQIPVVYGLASAYRALAVAKAMAGMGGFGGGGTTLFPPGTTNPNFGVTLPTPYHSGGFVRRDEIPAILQAGEYVINRRATARNLDTLRDINSGRYAGDKRQTEEKRPIIIHNIIDPNFITSTRRSDNEIINVISADIIKDGQTRQTIKKYV